MASASLPRPNLGSRQLLSNIEAMPSKPPARVRKSAAGLAASVGTPGTSTTPNENTPGGTPGPDDQSLIEQLNYADAPRPFKNPQYAVKIAGNRRTKTAKQIIQLERERYVKPKKRPRTIGIAQSTKANTPAEGVELDEEEAAPAPAAEAAPVVEEVVRKEAYIAYHEYDAPPSLKPAKRYCDVTGLEAPYTDPKSRLRYHNADIYELLKTFTSGAEQEYLALRGQGMVIR